MKIETIPVLGDNFAYLVICSRSGRAAAVDPADGRAVLERAEELGVELGAVWNTHHHFDHTGGNEEIARAHSDVEVVGHRADEGRIPHLTRPVGDGETIALGELRARIVHTPGHTRGAIVYLVDDAAFTGDTLFGAGCGRLFEGDAATMHRSLREIAALDAATRVFCGHEYTQKNLAFAATLEPDNLLLRRRAAEVDQLRRHGHPSVPSTLEQELGTNPFLRDSDELRASLRLRFPDDDLESAVQVFAAARRLRDVY